MNNAEASLQGLYSVICWDAKWDRTLNLSINFGQPSLSIREPSEVITDQEKVRELHKYRGVTLRGEWLFWVLSGYWRLDLRDFETVTGATSYKRKKMALARLDGQRLTRATIISETAATVLEFDLGAMLSVRRRSLQDDGDIWSLYKPNGDVVSVRADGKYHDGPGDVDPQRIAWSMEAPWSCITQEQPNTA